MKIQKNNYQNIKFNGELKFISKGTERIRREIINNDIIQELLSGKKDLYVNIRARKATKQELLMDKDNELYKVIFTYKKTAKTFFAKLLCLFLLLLSCTRFVDPFAPARTFRAGLLAGRGFLV